MHLFRLLVSLVFLTYVNNCSSQVFDNFNDGDFTKLPHWQGDSLSFTVDSGRLRLNALPATDTQFLVVSNAVGINATWEISVRLDFNPSSSNYCKIYLMSNKADLNSDLEAYFIKIGGTDDEVSLYRQDGLNEVELIDGVNKVLDHPTNTFLVKTSRNGSNYWTLSLDTGSGYWNNTDSAFDETYLQSRFFGISCRHTSTRSDKFSFDNVEVKGEIFTDTSAPFVLSNHLKDTSTWLVVLNEEIKALPHISSIEWDFNSSLKEIRLKQGSDQEIEFLFNNEFGHGFPMQLCIDSISDTTGNYMGKTCLHAVYNNPKYFKIKDIIINEIMADPNPVVEFLDMEYIELFNRTNEVILLENWAIADERDTAYLTSKVLEPGHYISLMDDSDSLSSLGIQSKLLMKHFLSLNNDGEWLYLISPSNRTIDSVNFDQKWMDDELKEEGGWSLELIDPNYRCNVSSNWSANHDESGGSPGKVNSVYNNGVDYPEVQFKELQSVNDSLIVINLSGAFLIPSDPFGYYSSQPSLSLDSLKFNNTSISLFPSSNHIKNNIYTLYFSGLENCSGRSQSAFNVALAFPEEADKGGVLINEVMFNPEPGGSDYIELYNNSNKVIDLSQLLLGSVRDDGRQEFESISARFTPLLPGEYLALCQDSTMVVHRYGNYGSLRQTDIPYMGDEGGQVLLLNRDSTIIDFMIYEQEWHFPLLIDREGVSMERIVFGLPGTDRRTWQSASHTSGYGTPGYRNSQQLSEGQGNQNLDLNLSIFSPDNDGFEDLLLIKCHSTKPGTVGSLRIYDQYSKLVRELANTTLLGSNELFVWDGTDDQGEKAPMGYYLILMETYDTDGNIERHRKSVVLAHYL
ncbi:MAG: lamin tail domain-containing protein [Vicingaceae bacterium]